MPSTANELTTEQLLALAVGSMNNSTPAKKDAPFTSYTVYLNEHYVGNFSLPENFDDTTKEAVMTALKAIGLELRAPGSTKRTLSMADLLPSAPKAK